MRKRSVNDLIAKGFGRRVRWTGNDPFSPQRGVLLYTDAQGNSLVLFDHLDTALSVRERERSDEFPVAEDSRVAHALDCASAAIDPFEPHPAGKP